MRILHAIHDFLPRHRAGSELYAYALGQALGERHEVVVLCAEYAPERPHGSLVRRTCDGLQVLEVTNNWAFGTFRETYRSPLLNRQLAAVLEEVRPDVLHLHSVLNLSMDLPGLAAARGVPVAMTLHDHHLVCPSGGQRVHVAAEHVCRDIDPVRCSQCFRESFFYRQMAAGTALARVGASGSLAGPWERIQGPAALRSGVDLLRRHAPRLFAGLLRLSEATIGRVETMTPRVIEERLQYVAEVYRHVDDFVAPSRALGEEHVRLGLPRAKLTVSDYGFRPLGGKPPRSRRRRLVIGFVGTLVWHKGVHVLLEAARRLPRDRYTLKIFGDRDTFPDYTRRLEDLAAGVPVEFMGGFDNARAREVYSQLDVLVVPSLWPENSPLVIHEAFMAGVPVVGARAGGIVDLVRDGESGLLYDAFSAPALAACLGRLVSEPQLVARLRAARPEVKSIAADAAEWEERYRRLAARRAGRT